MTEIKIKISPKPVQSFTLTLNKKFDINDGLVTCKLEFRPTQVSNMDSLYIFIEYGYSISSMTKDNDLKLEAVLIKPFELSPIQDLTPLSIYQCVLYCKKNLESALSGLFDKTDFKVEVTPLVDLEERLNAIIAGANSGEFSSVQ